MERYYQPEIECASRDDIERWQSERLVNQVRRVWENVPYYRKKMEEKGVTPEDIRSVEDLKKLPFLSKAASTPPPAPPASGWWPSTPSTTSTSGRTAAPGP